MSEIGKPTPGPWRIVNTTSGIGWGRFAEVLDEDNIPRLRHRKGTITCREIQSPTGRKICDAASIRESGDDDSYPHGEADARLIAEAGTVYHETGLSPRQLAEQRDRLIEALTPSAETKAAYHGEFEWSEGRDDHYGKTTRTVSWTVVKEIMAAILARAAIAKATAQEESNG